MTDRADGLPEIRLIELAKQFRDVRAVDGISLDIRPGEFFSMLGPSGCGKTTTAARAFISPDILADATVNPDIALLDKLVELLELGPDLDKYTQRWNALKA